MNQHFANALAGLPIAATKPSAAHSHKRFVCRHPDRIWIELTFIEWPSPTRITEANASNFHSPENQHTPAQVPHSKQPKTPESWLLVIQKMIDPLATEEQNDAAFQELPARAKGLAFWQKKNLGFVATQRISVLCFHMLRRGYLYSVAIQIFPGDANRN